MKPHSSEWVRSFSPLLTERVSRLFLVSLPLLCLSATEAFARAGGAGGSGDSGGGYSGGGDSYSGTSSGGGGEPGGAGSSQSSEMVSVIPLSTVT